MSEDSSWTPGYYLTRDFTVVEVITIEPDLTFPVRGVFRSGSKAGTEDCWTLDGTYLPSRFSEMPEDLQRKPPETYRITVHPWG